MKVLNFTIINILPALLNKTKCSTIRPAWEEKKDDVLVGNFPPYGNLYKAQNKLIEKPPRFKVGDKVKLLWNQRSKYSWFCSECGKGTLLGGECCNNRYIFNKHLGNAEITEVFKIKMNMKDNYFKLNLPLELLNESQDRIAKFDGFKSPKEMFSYFDKKYDLSQPKQFYTYRWRWLSLNVQDVKVKILKK